MSDHDIHSCGYYCDRPACIEVQRNELRNKLLEKKEWVGLTDEDLEQVMDNEGTNGRLAIEFARAIEAKLKEKNT